MRRPCGARGAGLLLVASLLLLFATSTEAVVTTFSKSISSIGEHAILERFGVAQDGEMRITGTVAPNTTYAVISVFRRDLWETWFSMLARSQSQLQLLCMFPSTLRFEVSGSFNISGTVPFSNQYTVQMLDCNEAEGVSSIEGMVTVVNPQFGKQWQHLSISSVGFGPALVFIIIGYSIAFVLWIVRLVQYRSHLIGIHYLCTLGLAVKIVHVVLELQYEMNFGETGEEFSVSHYSMARMFDTFSTACFILALQLIALGWSITTRRIQLRDRILIFVVFAFYVAIGVLHAFCLDNDSRCSALLLTDYIVRSIILLGVIVAMNFNITNMRNRIMISPWTPSTPAVYSKLNMLVLFRGAFLSYLMLPTTLLILMVTVLDWPYTWVHDVFQSVVLLAAYVFVGFLFRPQSEIGFSAITESVDG